MNILHLLDALLIDWASPRIRRTIHTALLLVASIVAVWLAVGGDWKEAAIAIATAFYTASNRSNTVPNTLPAGYDADVAVDHERHMDSTCCKYVGQDPLPVSGN